MENIEDEIPFSELPALDPSTLDPASDELMIYDASEADPTKKVKRITLEGLFAAFKLYTGIQLSISTSQVNPSTYGGSNGSVTVTGTGGSGSYQYRIVGELWTIAKATEHTFTNLTAGTRTFEVRDANNTGSVVSKIVTLTQPAQAPQPSITPAAPEFVYNDAARSFTLTHELGVTEIMLLTGSGSYVQYSGQSIPFGNSARAAGYWKAKTKAAAGRNESAAASSKAIAAVVTTPTYDTELSYVKTEGAGVSFYPATTERLLFDAIPGANQMPINSMFTYNGATSFATLPGEYLGKPYSYFDNAGVRREGTFTNNA